MDNALQGTADLAMSQASIPTNMGRITGRSMGDIDKTSKDFESMFMSQMLQPMFEGLKVDSVFGGGHAEEVMRGMMVQEYGKLMSKNSPLGIADAVKKEMIRKQGASASALSKYSAIQGG